MSESRFPKWVYRHGTEPDPRFSLANERTFLAWIRTALAFTAAGVALESVPLDLQPTFRIAAALILIVTGLFVPVLAWVAWARTEVAMRQDKPLPGSLVVVPLVVCLVLVALLAMLGVLLR